MDNLSPGKLLFYGNTEIKTSDHRSHSFNQPLELLF